MCGELKTIRHFPEPWNVVHICSDCRRQRTMPQRVVDRIWPRRRAPAGRRVRPFR